jgi:hypothetical protein
MLLVQIHGRIFNLDQIVEIRLATKSKQQPVYPFGDVARWIKDVKDTKHESLVLTFSGGIGPIVLKGDDIGRFLDFLEGCLGPASGGEGPTHRPA